MAEQVVRHRHGNRRMLYLIEQYKAAHSDEGSEVYPHLVARWAIRQGLYKRPPMDPEEILRRLLRRALRDEYRTDPQGREVRANHPVMEEVRTSDGVKLRSTWYPIFEMPPEKMRGALQLRRRAALADVIQLKIDFESYNDNNAFNATLDPPDFNFNKDIEEMNQPTDYPDSPLDDEEEEEEGDI